MTKHQQEQMMLMVITIVALGLGGYHLVIKPGLAKLDAANKAIDDGTTKAEKMETEISRIPKYTLKVDTLRASLSNEEARFVGEGRYYEFVELIKNCATNVAGMTVENVELKRDDGGKRGTYYQENWVSIGALPTYHGLGKWLADIEQCSPYVRVVNFQVNAMEGDNGRHPAQLTLSFLVKQGAE